MQGHESGNAGSIYKVEKSRKQILKVFGRKVALPTHFSLLTSRTVSEYVCVELTVWQFSLAAMEH